MEGEAQVVVFLGIEEVVRKDRRAEAEGMAQVVRAPQEVVAHPPEKLKAEKPRWQTSNPGKEGAKVASRWRLSHGKSKCGFPRGTGHQHEGERESILGQNYRLVVSGLANLGQNQFCESNLGQSISGSGVCHGPKGWGPNPETIGPRGGPTFRVFFPLPQPFSLFLSLSG